MMRCAKYSLVLIAGGMCWLTSNQVGSVTLQAAAQYADTAADSGTEAIRERISAYVDAFNRKDADAVGGFWSVDGVSVNQETGQRTSGREAQVQELKTFFGENSLVRLTGQVDSIRMVTPQVATVEGHTTLFVGEAAPVESTFTAVLVNDGDQWLISSSHERAIAVPTSPQDALRELDWLVGDWQDDSEESLVRSQFRWSASGVFLIRSFSAQFSEDEGVEGTQIFGWDPVSKQIRTWTFASDGSFGQGTVVRSDDGWMLKKWQILSDGRVASATRIMTRSDDETLTVRTIGHTVDGEPQPAAEPVTVVRLADDKSSTSASAQEGAE